MEINHKQKILMVHNYYQIPGGEDTVVANEKRLLEENGHEVVLYTRHNNELKIMSKFQRLGLPFTTIFNPRTYRDIKRIIREKEIEIVHVHNTLNLISPSVYYAAVRMEIPVIQTIHNFRFLCPGATFYRDGHICEDCMSKGLGCAVKHKCYRGSRVQTLICVINTWIHRHTGILRKINYICLTDFNKEKLLKLKQIELERIFVKPNFTYDTKLSNVENNYIDNQIEYMYVGRIDELKGVKTLFEAWKLMGDKAPKLNVCGTGPLEAWCRQFIAEYHLNVIEMLGKVDNSKVKEIMKNCKALILPTLWYEGFPVTIVEAYSSQLPVIGSAIGNVDCLINDNVTGWKFETGSAQELAETVKRTVNIDMTEIKRTLKELTLNSYSAENNYLELISIYKRIGAM